MTNQELIDYYANLLILQYVDKPKAYATIQALAKLAIMDQLPVQVMNAYNLMGDDIAVGVQLDVLGKYAGVTRRGYGFDGNPIELNDADFYKFIQMAIAINTSGSSLYDIQKFLNTFFPGEIYVFDYQNMHMSYMVDSGAISFELLQLFITAGLLPRPMGVQLSETVYVPDIGDFFGFRTYLFRPLNNKPFNSYTDYAYDRRWMSYKNRPGGGPVFTPFEMETDDGFIITTDDGDAILFTLYV